MASSPMATDLAASRPWDPPPLPEDMVPKDMEPEDMDALARAFARTHTLFFDIGTLRETQFTGIPNVAANLAREVLATNLPCHFFIGENIIRPEFIRFLLDTNGGAFFGYHHQLGQAMAGSLAAACGGASPKTGSAIRSTSCTACPTRPTSRGC